MIEHMIGDDALRAEITEALRRVPGHVGLGVCARAKLDPKTYWRIRGGRAAVRRSSLERLADELRRVGLMR